MSTITRVVSGEASESDSDDELTAAAELVAGRSQSSIGEELRQAGVVVQGEASETDSEEDEEMHLARAEQQQFPSQSNIPPLKVNRASRSPSIGSQSSIKSVSSASQVKVSPLDPPRYDTLLHRKLRERNISLQVSLQEAVAQAIQAKHKEFSNTNQMLTKSQMVIQDVCYSMRHFSDDIKRTNEKLDIISTSGYLPEFNFPSNGS
ncbi:biogenesis of lysosome-related organelles complex 1 subunit 3 [Strongylocentrotus purpuratus]|uniref:Biogenesis of lysosome-related organelles complex 1 subunit 3 n=1 Tax=Strongylocentrotus purpuratus TaxID=7668 RepID=A0A7M7RFX9_STRPU|nr:biogenesis of lysosome-related organelles complex 1 subunit 3-like [Strongylocentrotus purpuratus]XP_800620.2 biogenesis of lysosome-related organelles complex 1 subunit 3 [Strongylocentrotus purpuratus]|eukprot:XP_003725108.1 PREDICTED: biogenesis of lysosome-related organelles complex 1 subunit 3 isoform X2 [Strongylocentrotus purpuratus]